MSEKRTAAEIRADRAEALRTCYCHTCKRSYHPQGIARHRAMHRDKCEDCTITFTGGDIYIWRYSKLGREEER